MTIIRRRFLQYMAGISVMAPFVWDQVFARSVKKLDSKVNHILIIGSGVTGLSLGAMLSRKGYKVTVLERHPRHIGGHARSFTIQGVEFSAGPQFLWEFGRGDVGYRVLEYLGIQQKIPMVSLNSSFNNYYQYGNEQGILLSQGLSKVKSQIIDRFPAEKDGLLKFFEYFSSLYQASKFLEKRGLYMNDYSDMRSGIIFTSEVSFGAKLDVWNLAKKTLGQVFDNCNLSEKTRNFLYGQAGVFAENANDLSIGVYVAAMGHIFSNAYVPKDGFGNLINSLSEVITSNGGQVLTGKKVQKATVDKGRISRIITEDNTDFDPDHVISTLSPRITCNLLLPCDNKRFNYQPSNSLTSLYVGIKNDLDFVKRLSHRFIWWNSDEIEQNFKNPDMLKPPSHIYAGSQLAIVSSSSSKKDIIDLTIFAPGNFAQSKEAAGKSDQAYSYFKEAVTKQLLKTTEEYLLPDLSKNVMFTHLSTPWDLYTELGAEKGNVYGRRLSPESVLTAVNQIDSIDNLSFANATIGLPGVATCFNTATILFEKLTGEKV